MRRGLLLKAPWWVSAILSLVSYVGLRIVLPATVDEGPVANAMVQAGREAAIYIAAFFWFIAVFSAWFGIKRRRLVDQQTNLESLPAVSWKEFEYLVAEAFRRQGYAVDYSLGRGADGGVDERAEESIVVTSGSFTSEAVAFARGKPMRLIDGPQLLALVKFVQDRAKAEPKGGGSLAPSLGEGSPESVRRSFGRPGRRGTPEGVSGAALPSRAFAEPEPGSWRHVSSTRTPANTEHATDHEKTLPVTRPHRALLALAGFLPDPDGSEAGGRTGAGGFGPGAGTRNSSTGCAHGCSNPTNERERRGYDNCAGCELPQEP